MEIAVMSSIFDDILAADLDDENGAVAYCGSGVNATHDLLAMELAGIKNGRLYAGSWSDWSSRDAPIATGKDMSTPTRPR